MSVADFVAAASALDDGASTGTNPVIAQLSALRQDLGLSLKEVGGRSTLDEVSLTDWERGAASPSLEALEQWAMSLGRRLALLPLSAEPPHGVKVDWETRHLSVNGKVVRLTPMEWSIVERLAWAPGQLVTHRQLFKHLYNTERDCRAQSTAVRVRISKLRQKLPLTIEARWGQGYVLEGVEPSRALCQNGQPQPSPVVERQRSMREPALGIRPVRNEFRPTASRDFATLTSAPTPQDNRVAARPAQPLRAAEPMLRSAHQTPTASSSGRTEELSVIERFLSERGVTKCPNAGAMALAPLPALVWDKTKRKWVRPTACGQPPQA